MPEWLWKCIECCAVIPPEEDGALLEVSKEGRVRTDNLGKNLILAAHQSVAHRAWKNQDVLCMKCFDGFKWETAPNPKCSNCHYEYRWTCGDQAHGCAAYIGSSRAYVFGAFGSIFDTNHYDFTTATTHLSPHAAVCDLCVVQWLMDGVLRAEPNDSEAWWRIWKRLHEDLGASLQAQLLPELDVLVLADLRRLVASYVF